MGIHGLTKVIADRAPGALKEQSIQNYFGRKVAIDASMSIYQFLIAVRSEGNVLINEAGETTSHLMGLFYRTIRMVESGIKPCYVFDGTPPKLKSGELAKRLDRRKEAQEALERAQEAGDTENLDKYSRRTVKVTKQHNEDCKKLLDFMGIPWIDAPCEAEAQCAELCRGNKVFASGSEDMDTLTFGSNILLRHLTFSEARKMPILEIQLDRVLEGLQMNMDQFIDLCILLGCDYCDSIKGIGPHRAVQLIEQHKNLETIIRHVDKSKYPVPQDWPFEEARQLFKKPDVKPASDVELKWTEPDDEGLIQFLVRDNGFNEDRIRSGIEKLHKFRRQTVQGRLDSFFSAVPRTATPLKHATDASKQPATKRKLVPGRSNAGPKKRGKMRI